MTKAVTARFYNNSNSPWAWTDYDGMRMALMVPWAIGINLNVSERLVLVRLYACLVRGTDTIDKRVTQVRLAKHLDLSLSSVKRAYKLFIKLGLIEVLDG